MCESALNSYFVLHILNRIEQNDKFDIGKLTLGGIEFKS